MWAYQIATLIVLSALSKAEMPEEDFRIINRQDLLASDSDIFEDKDSKSFSQLLFDVARDQVLVGARDAIYRLSLRGLRPLERASWPSTPDKVQLCQNKGQTEEDCHNYVKVLLSYGHKLYACGTNAFSPVCSWREIESIGQVLERVSGVANCPYNPHSNVTAILAGTGEYFAGTPTDFSSTYTVVSRNRGASSRDLGTLQTAPYDQNWLNQPQFVGSFEDDYFVYFVFREQAVEFMNCGNAIYSRIARVCKTDSGGHLMMRENWSTFLKSRLVCSVPGDIPFYYDEVQSVEYLAHEKILVATFTTNENSIMGSAVCIYNMSAINAAFDGAYKIHATMNSTWEAKVPSQQARDHFRCLQGSRPHQTIEYLRYHLMYDSIKPISERPIYQRTSKRFTHITADVANTKSGKQFVLFVATQDEEILKLAVLPKMDESCLVEVWKVSDGKERFDVKKMQFVKDTMSLYLGTDTGVVRLGAQRCQRYKTQATCLGVTDPYCGWNVSVEKCVEASPHLYEAYLIQDTGKCTRINAALDGGWSSWSAAEPCELEGSSIDLYNNDQKPDMCMCRVRKCDNPAPVNGGKPCQGPSMIVSGCPVHGAWSPWSAWSACSATCGVAERSRWRSCSAPAPRGAGRVCLGSNRETVFCTDLPPCVEPIDPALAPIDGGWSTWSPWSSCISEFGTNCGLSGYRERKRTCNDPSPENGGLECKGLKVERQTCELKPCEMKKATAWTPWVQVVDNGTTDGIYNEKRFKFLCRAATSESIKLSLSKEEDRYCTPQGCSSTPPSSEPGWSNWTPWSSCSMSCGGGQQVRTRRCMKEPCIGPAEMVRPCNTQLCSGEWSCWSEWSACSGTCSSPTGHRTRTRRCLSPDGCDAELASQKRLCITTCDDDSDKGWGAWGAWSECANGERMRQRKCEIGACVGPLMQVAVCDLNDLSNDLLPSYSQNVEMAYFVSLPKTDCLSIGGMIGIVVAAFVGGVVLTLAGTIYCTRHGRHPWRRKTRVPSSPHYITAKQNSYVTVPLKDVPRKAKRQPSFSGIGGSGVIVKSNNISNANNHNTMTTPKLYPKAIANDYDTMSTLRRHSNLPNNRNNLDFEDDKFY